MTAKLLDVENLTMKFGGLVAIMTPVFCKKGSYNFYYWPK